MKAKLTEQASRVRRLTAGALVLLLVLIVAAGNGRQAIAQQAQGNSIVRVLAQLAPPPAAGDAAAYQGFEATVACGAFRQTLRFDATGEGALQNAPAGTCTVTPTAKAGYSLWSITTGSVMPGTVNLGTSATFELFDFGSETVNVTFVQGQSAPAPTTGVGAVVVTTTLEPPPPAGAFGPGSPELYAGFEVTLSCGTTFRQTQSTPPDRHAEGSTRLVFVGVPAGSCTITQSADKLPAGSALVGVSVGGATATNGATLTVVSGQALDVAIVNKPPAAGPGGAVGAAATGTVAVTLAFEPNNPTAGHEVRITCGAAYTSAETNDATGRLASFTGVPAGSCTVTVTPARAAVTVRSVRVRGTTTNLDAQTSFAIAAGQTVQLDITLATGTGGQAPAAPAPGNTEKVRLFPGCNLVALTFGDAANGAPAQTVASAVTPATALDVMWKYDGRTGRFAGFRAGVPAFANDFTTANLFDAVYICVNAAAELARPTVDTVRGPLVTDLATGCNLVTLVTATGTATAEVARQIEPAGALQVMWQFNNETKRFAGFRPGVPDFANDFRTITRFDAVVVCMNAAGSLTQAAP